MLVRAIALSFALLVGTGVIIPLATDTTEAGPRKARKKQDFREFDRTKKREYTEFFESEKQKRRLFFKQHHNGPERRDYIKSFIQRREQFMEAQKAAKERKRQEHADELRAFEKKADELLGKTP